MKRALSIIFAVLFIFLAGCTSVRLASKESHDFRDDLQMSSSEFQELRSDTPDVFYMYRQPDKCLAKVEISHNVSKVGEITAVYLRIRSALDRKGFYDTDKSGNETLIIGATDLYSWSTGNQAKNETLYFIDDKKIVSANTNGQEIFDLIPGL